jgi:hypothetical protein
VNCPTCSAFLSTDAVICRRCGSVIPIEIAARRLLRAFRQIFVRPIDLTTFTWLMALSPVVIVPPLLVLVLVATDRATRDSGNLTVRKAALTSVALANVGLSLAFWFYARQELPAIGFFLSHWLASFWRESPAPTRNPNILDAQYQVIFAAMKRTRI